MMLIRQRTKNTLQIEEFRIQFHNNATIWFCLIFHTTSESEDQTVTLYWRVFNEYYSCFQYLSHYFLVIIQMQAGNKTPRNEKCGDLKSQLIVAPPWPAHFCQDWFWKIIIQMVSRPMHWRWKAFNIIQHWKPIIGKPGQKLEPSRSKIAKSPLVESNGSNMWRGEHVPSEIKEEL